MNKGGFLNIIIAIIVFVAIAGGGVYFVIKNQNQVNVPPSTPTPVPVVSTPRQTSIIDLDANPFIPTSILGELSVEEHKKGGKVTIEKRADGELYIDGRKVVLYISPNQKYPINIETKDLIKELQGKTVLNANVLDYLLAHPDLIPKSWNNKDGRGLHTFFYGTVYEGPCVRYLAFDPQSSSMWSWGCASNGPRNDYEPAAILENAEGNALQYNPPTVKDIRTIDLDADPSTPQGYANGYSEGDVLQRDIIEVNVKGGKVTIEKRADGELYIDGKKVILYYSQKDGKYPGSEIQKELQGKKVINADVLDFLLSNHSFIPVSWKTIQVHFFGTIYRTYRTVYANGDKSHPYSYDYLYVRNLTFDLGRTWNQFYPRIDGDALSWSKGTAIAVLSD